MSLLLGAIADDYTGASDLANVLSRNGLRTVQIIGLPDTRLDDQAALPLDDIDAVVVALKSRATTPDQAVRWSEAAARWLTDQGARHILFKVCSTFDSTDQGNIGPVADALLAALAADHALVTPAFPQTGRTVYQGHLFVGRQPLHESPLKDHPLNPMRDSDLTRVLARQSRHGVGLIDFATVDNGVEAVLAAASRQAAGGHRLLIADAVTEDQLVTLGAAAAAGRLSVGASGLGLGLARFFARGLGNSSPAADPVIGGPALCLAGSCSAATLAQIERASQIMPVLRLDTEALFDDTTALETAVAWARERLARGPVLISSSAPPDQVAALQTRHGRETAGRVIETAMATLAAALVGDGVRRLVVAGGETSGAVVDLLGLPAFRIGSEIAPGVPVLHSLAGPFGPMVLALKSGNFGGPDFFADALALMP